LAKASRSIADEIIQQMRLIKSAAEIADLRNAGKVADAMMDATRGAVRVGVREFELSLAGDRGWYSQGGGTARRGETPIPFTRRWSTISRS
jgi:Xaa-Pro aminopeptidase